MTKTERRAAIQALIDLAPNEPDDASLRVAITAVVGEILTLSDNTERIAIALENIYAHIANFGIDAAPI